mmetsp:Transcript_2/g.4  ORF Transcript_2/g.4 Transcript_2/m.4 type:complete len:513 (+) Transcript_2:170-1708(+)
MWLGHPGTKTDRAGSFKMQSLPFSIPVLSILLASSLVASLDAEEEPYVYEDFGRCHLVGACRRTSIVNGTWEDSGIAYKLERLCLERAQTFFRWCGNEGCEAVEAVYLPTARRRRYPEGCEIQGTRTLQQDQQQDMRKDDDEVDRHLASVPSKNADSNPFKAFEALQDETMLQVAEKKVLLVRINPFTGFANRLFAIASSMILCLVLGDRGLLVDWPVDTTPRKHPNRELSFMGALHDLLDVPHILDFNVVVTKHDGAKFHQDVKFWHSFHDDDENFLSLLRTEEDLNQHFRSRVIQVFSSYGYFYSHLILDNPHLRAPLERMMGRECCFYPVLQYLMKPSKIVAFRLWRMNRRMPSHANFTGVHLRTFLMNEETRLTALRCALNLSEGKEDGRISIFSDAEKGIQEANRFFEGLHGDRNVSVHVSSAHGRSSFDEVVEGVASLFHLAQSVRMVGTTNSTFLILAAMLSCKDPTGTVRLHHVQNGNCIAVECKLPPAPVRCVEVGEQLCTPK